MRFTWDKPSQRYRDPAGRFVSRERVRLAVDRVIVDTQAEMRAASLRLSNGTMSVDAWWSTMRTAVKDINLASAAAARGGFAQLTASDYGRVGAAVKKQYAYLDRFVGDIEAGLKLGPGFIARAMSYANSGRVLYHELVGEAMERAGFDQERNRLQPAEHCEGPNSCIEQTARRWVPIGELVPIGDRVCRGGCQCFIEYRKSHAAAVAADDEL